MSGQQDLEAHEGAAPIAPRLPSHPARGPMPSVDGGTTGCPGDGPRPCFRRHGVGGGRELQSTVRASSRGWEGRAPGA